MCEKKPFDLQVDKISNALTAMRIAHQETGGIDLQAWLEALLKHYTDRMLADNDRIWRTGALFVPIALAAFAALTAIKCLQIWHTLVLSVPSIALMLAWNVMADSQRVFQQNSEAWLIAIQREMKLEVPRDTRKSAVRKIRWTLLGLVGFAWVLVIIALDRKWFIPQCVP